MCIVLGGFPGLSSTSSMKSWVSQGFPRVSGGFLHVSQGLGFHSAGFPAFPKVSERFPTRVARFLTFRTSCLHLALWFPSFRFLLGGADLSCIVMLLLVRSSKRLVRAKHADMFAAAIQMSFKLLVIAGRIVTSDMQLQPAFPSHCPVVQRNLSRALSKAQSHR